MNDFAIDTLHDRESAFAYDWPEFSAPAVPLWRRIMGWMLHEQ